MSSEPPTAGGSDAPLGGHLRTIGALIRRTLRPTKPPPSEPWSTRLRDPVSGELRVTGRLSPTGRGAEVVVLIHGLGGSSESGYLLTAARAAAELGLASLRLNLRGADGKCGDFYHGGLTADLAAAVEALQGAGYRAVFVLGFSLGGHVALRFATEVGGVSRVLSVGAICSPLDLAVGADSMDRPGMAPYRAYVLRRLKRNYKKTAALGAVPTDPARIRRVRTLREWDSLTVVPRFGFRNADDYYAQASVGSRLGELRRPALLIAARDDPMIPPSAISPSLAAARHEDHPAAGLTTRWKAHGGHMGFSAELDLGLAGPRGDASQALLWLRRAGDGKR